MQSSLAGAYVTAEIEDTNEGNFGGSWSFSGGFGLTSIERYQLTLQMQEQGFTPAEIRAAGGGATSFRLNSGNPFADVSQTDYGVFIQDDWRVKPNLTFSYGLRYETQTNAHSKYDFAPRLAVAWSPGAANSARPPKMVIRFGTRFLLQPLQRKQYPPDASLQWSKRAANGGD